MIVLCESWKLQILYESLEKHIPESLKVYGTIFNIKEKNPFNLEVLVDAWPDYQIVITRPRKEEMKDDQDHYTNTYQIFTKTSNTLEEVLANPEVINWEQIFQIQGCQEIVDAAVRKIAASKSVQVDSTNTRLFPITVPPKFKMMSDDKTNCMEMINMVEESKKESFLNIFLDTFHAKLVNEQWDYGKNEKSLKYIKRCLQHFPGFGVLGPEGDPISWLVTEQSCELRMGYTVPKYRGRGNMWQIGYCVIKYLIQKKVPFYLHVAKDKERNHELLKSFGIEDSCDWYQWKCIPKKYC
ncbi:glycine N-acyltransferase-like protein 2 [Erinaceus europaeus]|uniref:Glycine N-acyltransferase-like protein n=1 Tax=Erinaceus europaeus TaxID=9365 RepID=A0ABM3W6L8_ERIEU|nr:glycine N-acyltransferase-like protein 2 [Erinaceus europaeus]